MAEPSNDPRLRPFRAMSWALYLVVSVGFSGLVIFSVSKSVFEMSPGRPEAAEKRSVPECVAGLTAAFEELERERAALGRLKAVGADQGWMVFRNGWVRRARQLEATCDVEAPDREALRRAFAALHEVMDVATVNATQVSGQMGPALDSFRAQLGALD
ncbi:MAG: hypothetical protein INH41_02840 [Myxococcaceae bacterium]|jgi:hypothetical protein|nr:hypothetical protein [Myxococcaceae bacterium]MCA3011316.1 hypothetical protein [Myxococcaceae bacterium]